jgi:cytochrome c oxidase subunit 2
VTGTRHDFAHVQDLYLPIAAAVFALIVVALAVVLVRYRARPERAKPGFRVDAVAFQWGWQFSYPSRPGVVDRSAPNRPATLHVPAGTTVEVSLRTRDVVHAFWIPDLRFKRDAWPRKTARFDLRFPAGTVAGVGHCAQYCGLKHSDMVFFVDAMDPARFASWSRTREGRA